MSAAVRRFTPYLVGLFFSLTIVGCGFQFRGTAPLPSALTELDVRGEDRDLVRAVSAALRQRGVKISAQAKLRVVVDASFAREVLSTDARGRATAYAYLYRVQYQLSSQSAAQSFTLRRTYDYNPDLSSGALQAEQEVAFLSETLRELAARRIVAQLGQQ